MLCFHRTDGVAEAKMLCFHMVLGDPRGPKRGSRRDSEHGGSGLGFSLLISTSQAVPFRSGATSMGRPGRPMSACSQ